MLIDNDIVLASLHSANCAHTPPNGAASALEPVPPRRTHRRTPFVFGVPLPAQPTLLHPCAQSSSSSASATAYAVPPTYALHTAVLAPPRALLARYLSTITLTGVLSARTEERVRTRRGTEAVRESGAPAVGRPAGCARGEREGEMGAERVRAECGGARVCVCGCGCGRGRGRGRGTTACEAGWRARSGETHFGIFATRASRRGEEIVVGGGGTTRTPCIG